MRAGFARNNRRRWGGGRLALEYSDAYCPAALGQQTRARASGCRPRSWRTLSRWSWTGRNGSSGTAFAAVLGKSLLRLLVALVALPAAGSWRANLRTPRALGFGWCTQGDLPFHRLQSRIVAHRTRRVPRAQPLHGRRLAIAGHCEHRNSDLPPVKTGKLPQNGPISSCCDGKIRSNVHSESLWMV